MGGGNIKDIYLTKNSIDWARIQYILIRFSIILSSFVWIANVSQRVAGLK